MRVGFEGGQASTRTLLKEGDVRFVALSWGGAVPPTTFDDAYRRQVWTAHHWQHWLARGRFPDHPWRSYLQRSALTLKGLTYAPTGTLVAAGSTSLPETPGGDRNYDYRFTWIRDATFALWGMHSLGFDWEAVDFFSFIADIAEKHDDLQIMYGIGGERELVESELDHLPGYAGSRPVRIGNAAYAQQQHDVWGALLDSVYLHTKAVDHLDSRVWPILQKQVGEALKHWREPDAGHLGSARATAPLHVLEDHVLGRRRPGLPVGRDDGRGGQGRRMAASRPTRSRRTSSRTAWTSAACSRRSTAARRSTRRSCSPRSCGSWPRTTRGSAPP